MFIITKVNNTCILNKRQRIPNGQSKMNNPEKLATQGTKDGKKTQHNMSWTPLYTNNINKT